MFMQERPKNASRHRHHSDRKSIGEAGRAGSDCAVSADSSRPRASLGPILARSAMSTLSAILVLMLGFNLYFPLASRLTGNPYPSLFGFRQAVVLSNSMAPALVAGDLIVIRAVPAYQSGDILTYVDNQILVTHRLHAANPDGLTLQGDANRSPDRLVHPDQVLGKTILRLPAAGRISQWLRTKR